MNNPNGISPLKHSATFYNKQEISNNLNLGYRYKLHQINQISEKLGYTNTGNLFVRLGHIGHSIDKDIKKAIQYMSTPAKPNCEDNSIKINDIKISDISRKIRYSIGVIPENLINEQQPNLLLRTKFLGDNLNRDGVNLKLNRNNKSQHIRLVSYSSQKNEDFKKPSNFLVNSSPMNKTIKFNSIFAHKNEIFSSPKRNSNFFKLAEVFSVNKENSNLIKSADDYKISLNSEKSFRLDPINCKKSIERETFPDKIMTIRKFKVENSPMKSGNYGEEEFDIGKSENFSMFSQNPKRRRIKIRNNLNSDNIKNVSKFNISPRKEKEVINFEQEKEKSKTQFLNFHKNETKRNTMRENIFKENENEVADFQKGVQRINLYNINQYKKEQMRKFYGELDHNCKKLESIDMKIKTELGKAYKICDVFEKKMNK